MTTPREAFAEIASRADGEIDLAAAALWIAAEEYPDLVVAQELARLDALAAGAAERVDADGPLAARVTALNRYLFSEQAFRGNRDDYYDPRNSYLNEVLARRLGIPISLALVYLAVAERLGLEAAGISFPGHFLLECRDASGEQQVVDAFAGRTLSLDECRRRLSAAAGRPVALDPKIHLRAATRREVSLRVLTNLKQIFVGRGDFGRALSCSDRILLLTPDSPREHKEREAFRARVRLH